MADMNRRRLMPGAISSQIKVVLERTRLPFDILGAVLFGSRVKEKATASSDIDLLVIAKGINPKRHRRTGELMLIKRNLPLMPLDILLLTEEEIISNFKNHNPLFLDIAEEGIIVLDKTGSLESLMVETREYIRQRGIKRFGDGWIFPVKQGVPTFLSKISNKDFSLAMLKDGERDFIIGKRLIEDSFYDKAVYHFQQAVEKCVKSILIAIGIFQKTHFVGEILKEVLEKESFPQKWKKEILEVAEISESIEPEVTLSRYPGIIDDSLWLPYEEYENEDAESAMVKAEKVLSTAIRFVNDWFSG